VGGTAAITITQHTHINTLGGTLYKRSLEASAHIVVLNNIHLKTDRAASPLNQTYHTIEHTLTPHNKASVHLSVESKKKVEAPLGASTFIRTGCIAYPQQECDKQHRYCN
jgi:hypothetical protein